MTTFLVGQRYRNRKGEYEVLEIENDKMKVCYDDGEEEIVASSIQARIFENMQSEEISKSKKMSIKPQNQQFYWSLGFLLARKPTLIAFIPQHALRAFENKFHDATGRELSDNEKGIIIHPPKTDKRWYELRVTFIARANELHLLNFGDDVNIVEGSPDNKLWNINNNRFFLRLLEFNFSTGSQQNKTNIERAIPNQYFAAFKEGYTKSLEDIK